MQIFFYTVSILALLLNGIYAIYGGCSLIHYPDGSGLGLHTRLLLGSGFTNYRIPGMVLVLVNGILNLGVLLAVLFRFRYYYLLLVGQGLLLLGWLQVQSVLVYTPGLMPFVLSVIGLVLIVAGMALTSFTRTTE